MGTEKERLPAELSGVVTHYEGNGRKLGYPTANIDTHTSLPDGVYFGYADMGRFRHHPAIIFIGTPTTLGDRIRRAEAYLLDIPDNDYYGQEIGFSVEHRHRQNYTFGSVEELLKVMKDDEVQARKWFASKQEAKANRIGV